MLGNLMNALMQPASGSQQGSGTDMLSQVVGGLLGGSQQGGAPVNQLLGGLEQIIGGNPSSGQALPLNQGSASDANNPIMGLLNPVANAVAAKTGISPLVATTVAGIAMHYLLSSHPAAGTSGSAPLNLASMSQQMASGSVPSEILHNSGMVNAVVQATGLTQQEAAKSLDATFTHLQSHVNMNVRGRGHGSGPARDKKE